MPNLPSKRETRIRLLASMDTDRMQLQFYNWDGERMLLVPKATFPATPVHKNLFEMVEEKQAEADLAAFEARCRAWPLVRECHMLNGEIDFILKCVSPDLSSFQNFLTEELLKANNVASVKTSLVIRCAKDEPGVPFAGFEPRPEAS